MSDYSGAQFIAGSMFGVRLLVPYSDSELGSIIVTHAWRPGINNAFCRVKGLPSKHTPGDLHCRCGFYACFNHETLYSMGMVEKVPAIIEGFGRVTVGEKGFRAEKARIVALIHNTNVPIFGISQRKIEPFAELYKVPVFGSFKTAVDEFPLTDPQGLTQD